MPYFGTLSRIYTKLVCATHSCALQMALSLKLFMEKERLFGSRKTFLPSTEKKERWFLSGYYGKACCYALQGEIGQAIDNLQKAIDIAPRRSRSEAKHNPDFDSIRDDERFRALM
jgi:hypothetical protein